MEESNAATSAASAATNTAASSSPGVSIYESGATPSGTLAVQVQPATPPDETWKHVAEVTGAVAWPLVAIVAFVAFRTQIALLVHNIATRIRDPATSFKAGPFELGRQVRDLKLEAEETNARVQVLTHLEATPRSEVAKPIPEQLRTLAGEYVAFKDPDPKVRIQEKDDLAASMASLVLQEHISRESLAEENSDGIRTALATVVNTAPSPGDDEWLAKAAVGAKMLHTRYRIMMAVARLARIGMLTHERARQFLTLSESYRDGADALLLERIARTIEILSPIAE